MLNRVAVGLLLVGLEFAGGAGNLSSTGAPSEGCLAGSPPYSFEGFSARMDGGSIAGTVADSSGLTEDFWWDCGFNANGAAYLGATDSRDPLGRRVKPGSSCEAEFIAALRAFADRKIPRHLQAGLVAAIYDGTTPTGEVERVLKHPSPLPLDAVAAAHMARELEKHAYE
jgi:hypothetical protein